MKINESVPQAARKQNPAFAEVRDRFSNPPQRFAPFEFWFWDESLSQLGIKPVEMAAELCRKGFNPGYAHARTNYASALLGVRDGVCPLQPSEWLTEDWFREITKVLEQARRDGTVFSITDDFGWPSLQAGGRVLEQHPDMFSRSLFYDTYDVKQGESIDLPECDFAVCGRAVSYRDANAVEYTGGGWQKQHNSFEMTPASIKTGLPFNMSARYTAERDSTAVFHPVPTASGRYTFGARWSLCGDNAERVLYTVENAGKRYECPVNQKQNLLQWNDLTEVEIDASLPVTVTVSNASGGVMCVDAIRFVPVCGGESVIVDDLQTLRRCIATLDPDSLRYADGKTFTAEDGDYRVYAYSIRRQRGYDGSLVNNLDSRLGKCFTDIAYQPYLDKCRDYMGFGKPMEGFFADTEGGYGYKLAWSEDLEKRFLSDTGRDLRLCLPFMCDDASDGSEYRVRGAWYETVSDIFTENFSVPADLCARNGMYYTMHTWEESLPFQVNTVGDYFKLNRALSLPGTDCLVNTAYNPANFWDTLSISDFDGKRYMAEMMALAWLNEYNMTELLKQVNCLAAWGVGHIITHSLKMTRVKAQEVVTPDFYDIDPAWKDMKCWTDYVRRISYINSLGYIDADTLLLNPMESVWCLTEGSNMDKDYDMIDVGGGIPANTASHGGTAGEINRIYHETIRVLAHARVAFLTADRYYTERMNREGGCLTYGDRCFRTVILPHMTVMDRACAEKLLAFAEDGGRVVILGVCPSASLQYGRSDPYIKAIFARMTALHGVVLAPDMEDVIQTVSPCVAFRDGAFDMLALPRVVDGKHIYWLANNNPDFHTAVLTFPVVGAVTVLDPMCGTAARVPARTEGHCTEVDRTFAPWQGLYIVIDPQDTTACEKPAAPTACAVLDAGWRAVLSDTDNQNSRVIHPVELPDELLRGTDVTVTDWRSWGFMPDRFAGTVDYLWDGTLPSGAAFLDLGEVGQTAELLVNGIRCGTRIAQPFVFDIREAVRDGENSIRVRVSNSIASNAGIHEPLCGMAGPVRVLV